VACLRRAGCEADWCEINEGRDFLACDKPIDCIVTNPPWSLFWAFLQRGMTRADHIVFLAPLAHFMTFQHRLTAIDATGFGLREAVLLPSPPKAWQQTSRHSLQCISAATGRTDAIDASPTAALRQDHSCLTADTGLDRPRASCS
jgi:hypothetical protein